MSLIKNSKTKSQQSTTTWSRVETDALEKFFKVLIVRKIYYFELFKFNISNIILKYNKNKK